MATDTPKLTDEQAEAMLKQLSRHFHEPVLPASRYCKSLDTWGRCIGERADHLRKELFPNFHDWAEPKPDEKGIPRSERTPKAKAQQAEYEVVAAREALQPLIPAGLSVLSKEAAQEVLTIIRRSLTSREERIATLVGYEHAAHQVDRTFLAIRKSNLLARLMYSGEKLRETMCPEHKGKWSGIEWSDSRCPHKCQLTGWVQEGADQGKPLPGVMAVNMIPTGEGDGRVTMIRDVDGVVLGKAVVHEMTPPKKPDGVS